MSSFTPQLDRDPLKRLWTTASGDQLLMREELEAIMNEAGVDPDLLSELVGLALGRYRRIEERGRKAEMRRDVEEVLRRHDRNM